MLSPCHLVTLSPCHLVTFAAAQTAVSRTRGLASFRPRSTRSRSSPRKERATLKVRNATVKSLAFSPDGTLLAVGSGDQTVSLLDVQTGKERVTLKGHSDTVLAVAFSPDGTLLASASRDHTVKLWEMRQGDKVTR